MVQKIFFVKPLRFCAQFFREQHMRFVTETFRSLVLRLRQRRVVRFLAGIRW
jgi:hypothetical protein